MMTRHSSSSKADSASGQGAEYLEGGRILGTKICTTAQRYIDIDPGIAPNIPGNVSGDCFQMSLETQNRLSGG